MIQTPSHVLPTHNASSIICAHISTRRNGRLNHQRTQLVGSGRSGVADRPAAALPSSGYGSETGAMTEVAVAARTWGSLDGPVERVANARHGYYCSMSTAHAQPYGPPHRRASRHEPSPVARRPIQPVADPARTRHRHRLLIFTVLTLIFAASIIAAFIAIRLLESVGFNHRIAAGAVAAFTADLFVSSIFVARTKRRSSRI